MFYNGSNGDNMKSRKIIVAALITSGIVCGNETTCVEETLSGVLKFVDKFINSPTSEFEDRNQNTDITEDENKASYQSYAELNIIQNPKDDGNI